jgi:predicted Holliday junction resolvase-like endonuclease
MINLNTLDTLIAVVVVLLTLSLVVQAMQAAIKKFFKLKSRQLEESLVDLFENALVAAPNAACLNRRRLPTMHVFKSHPAKLASPAVQTIFEAVMKKFREVGRVDSGKGQALDSLSKDDLRLILQTVRLEELLPDSQSKLGAACTHIRQLQAAVEELKQLQMSGVASAQFAQVQQALAPLLNDLDALFDGQEIKANLLLNDVLGLREVKLDGVFGLLGIMQQQLQSDLAAARAEANAEPRVAALEQLAAGLQQITRSLSDTRQLFDAAIAPLRTQLQSIEQWYDTVMRSFEERYSRGMKTYAFFLGLIVAVWLNANIFSIYQDISGNDAKRAALVQSGESALQRYKEQLAAPEVMASPANEQKLKDLIKTTEAEVRAEAANYQRFGFKTWGELRQELSDKQKTGGALSACGYLLYTALGWLIMAALLSVGAPFWQDVLESLFGIKNFLRKRGGEKEPAES